MKRVLVTVLASLFLSAFPQATTGNDDGGWSSPVNGLQARLSVARGQALNGTPLITTYLELRNVADVANVMELPFNPGPMRFEVIDEQDKLLAQKGMVYDVFRSASVRPIHLFDQCFDHDYLFKLPLQGAGCPFKWTAFYCTPSPVPSFPACEPNFTNC
jgi:hypothetical protein